MEHAEGSSSGRECNDWTDGVSLWACYCGTPAAKLGRERRYLPVSLRR
jgi:hypothetical protein